MPQLPQQGGVRRCQGSTAHLAARQGRYVPNIDDQDPGGHQNTLLQNQTLPAGRVKDLLYNVSRELTSERFKPAGQCMNGLVRHMLLLNLI